VPTRPPRSAKSALHVARAGQRRKWWSNGRRGCSGGAKYRQGNYSCSHLPTYLLSPFLRIPPSLVACKVACHLVVGKPITYYLTELESIWTVLCSAKACYLLVTWPCVIQEETGYCVVKIIGYGASKPGAGLFTISSCGGLREGGRRSTPRRFIPSLQRPRRTRRCGYPFRARDTFAVRSVSARSCGEEAWEPGVKIGGAFHFQHEADVGLRVVSGRVAHLPDAGGL
jgi:hypothetical protein